MIKTYHFSQKKCATRLLFCLFIILWATGTSDARFLNSKLAEKTPRTRNGSYPSSTMGTNFLNPDKLGPHTYKFSFKEKNGMLYTCKAGHIDTAHLRKAADWTAFLAANIFEKIKQNETKFSFKLMEPSRYHVEITYPENWKDLSEKEKEDITFDISVGLAEYFVFTATTWHEIITWFGYKCTGFLYPEFTSAFTWEDTFSNLLGTHIAAVALRDTEHEYNEAMTLAFKKELEKLGVQPKKIAKRATKTVRGKWFSGDLLFSLNMKKRNLDIGLNDGFITPSIIPSVAACEGVEALQYPAPNPDFLGKYGFSLKFEIEPREFEKKQILRIIYPENKDKKERIQPAVHFAAIMDYIKEEAITKHDYDVDLGDTTSETLVATDVDRDSEFNLVAMDVDRDSEFNLVAMDVDRDSEFNLVAMDVDRDSEFNLVAMDVDRDSEFNIEELASIAAKWLETVNQ